jgi:hypothetical protein
MSHAMLLKWSPDLPPWYHSHWIAGASDPWKSWPQRIARQLEFHIRDWNPPDAEFERHLMRLCLAADRRWLHIVATTEHFADIWRVFRSDHLDCPDRNRYLIWRAAALRGPQRRKPSKRRKPPKRRLRNDLHDADR